MTELSREALGTAVQRARQQVQLSQEELGLQTGLGQTVVSRIESGTRKIDLVELLRIASALHTTVDEILASATAIDADRAGTVAGSELELLALRLGDQSTSEQTRQALKPVEELVAALRELEGRATEPDSG